MCIVECNLCGMDFDTEDPDYKKRTDRHTEFHKLHIVRSKGENGQLYEHNLNITLGEATYGEKN